MNDACAVDVTPSRPETDMRLSLDIDKPALSSDASVADLSVQLVSRPATPAGGVDRLSSDESTATMLRVSPTLSLSRAVCPQSLSPAGRVSTNPTEMSDREENKPELPRPAISGIVFTVATSVHCIVKVHYRILRAIERSRVRLLDV